MTSYGYFPGCSLRGTGVAYEESLLALFRLLERPLQELKDWNCCGATSYMSIDESSAAKGAAPAWPRARPALSDRTCSKTTSSSKRSKES